jgi:hypothetical protein
MAWFIFSTEALPNPQFMGLPGYTPDSEYIKFGGVTLPCLPKGQWLKLPDSFSTLRSYNWKQKPEEVDIPIRKFKGVIENPERGFAERGVILLDHEPTEVEKQRLERLSAELNQKFRKKHVEFYENQRQIALARQGTYPATPYVDECYEILRLEKPYSVEALQAQRSPGEKAAQQIADAISAGARENAKANAEAIAEVVQDFLTRPKQEAKAPVKQGG